MSRTFDALNRMGGEAAETLARAMNEIATPANPATGSEEAPSALHIPAPAFELPTGSELPAGPEPSTDRKASATLSPEPVAPDVYRLKLSLNSPLLPFGDAPNRASEEYRIIRTKIRQHPKRPRVIVVSSASPGDGKSVTAINLAGALSLKSDANVLLVDTDFRRSTIAKTLGVPPSPGLSDVLTGSQKLDDVIIRAEQLPNLRILSAGESESNPAELLDSPAWLGTIQELRAQFEYVVLDSPPIRAVADYELIQAVADGVVVVVRPDHTKRTIFDEALKTLPSEKLLGVVMNCVADWFVTKQQHYGYAYQARAARG